MSNSPLICHTHLSPNCSRRTHAIDTITIHCMAGDASIEACGNLFADPARRASSNYGIGSDGRIAMYVEENCRSWCSSNSENDDRAITIEVANTQASHPWPCSDSAFAALLDLVTDICWRNGIKRLLWCGDKSLIGQVDKQNMTVHRWFDNKACPGDFLYQRHGQIAAEVNRRLTIMEEAMNTYNTIEELPDWAKPTITKLVDAGVLKGRGGAVDGSGRPADLDLTEDMVRLLVIHDRIGIYGR